MNSISHIGDIERWSLKTPTFYLKNINNKKLSDELLTNAKRKTEDTTSTFFEDFEANIKDCPTALDLLDSVQDIATEYYGNVEMVEWWAQIHQQGESTNQHHHHPATTSWCYWVNIPVGAGKFVFVLNDYASVMSEVDPVEGMLMFFPGWVSHKVTRNLSKDYRICISGNIR